MRYAVERFIAASVQAKTPDEIFEALNKILEQMGFDSWVYALANDHASRNMKAGFIHCTWHSEEWIKHYTEKNYYKDDPNRYLSMTMLRPYQTQEILDSKHVSKIGKIIARGAFEVSRIKQGIVFPIHGPNVEIAGVSLYSKRGGIEFGPELIGVINALVQQLHMSYFNLQLKSSPPLVNQIELTMREREVLMWSAEGKSVSDIGEIMNTSADNVKYHLKKVYLKLGATTRIQAVLRAITMGLINPPVVDRIPGLPD